MTELDTPCRCPRCGWLGTLHEPACHPTPETALDVCPRCAVPTEVQRLGQKGLDALRAEHALLLKGSYQKDASADESGPSVARRSSGFSRSSASRSKTRDRGFKKRCERHYASSDAKPKSSTLARVPGRFSIVTT